MIIWFIYASQKKLKVCKEFNFAIFSFRFFIFFSIYPRRLQMFALQRKIWRKFSIIESLFHALFRHEVRPFFTILPPPTSSSYLSFYPRACFRNIYNSDKRARLHHGRGKWLDTPGYKFLVIKDAAEAASETFIIERDFSSSECIKLPFCASFTRRTRLDILFVPITLSFHFLRNTIALRAYQLHKLYAVTNYIRRIWLNSSCFWLRLRVSK